MSRGASSDMVVGVNWGSTNFRAYLIGPEGAALDEFAEAKGVVGLDRPAMAGLIKKVADRWPEKHPIYASGMIGSHVGWASVPYASAPAGASDLKAAALETAIGDVAVRILPGVSCRRRDGQPDVLRGEEIDLIGLARLANQDGLVVLPGAHTKWAWLQGERIGEFFTSMSGEMFDRLTEAGLLSSIVDGAACDGPAFQDGVAMARERRLSLGTLLFGARARAMQGDLVPADAASYLRGLLIGSEIADALELYPALGERPVSLAGSVALCELYASALAASGVHSEIVDPRLACLVGFRALHEANID